MIQRLDRHDDLYRAKDKLLWRLSRTESGYLVDYLIDHHTLACFYLYNWAANYAMYVTARYEYVV